MADLVLADAHTRVRIRSLLPGAIRVTHAAPGSGDFPPDRPWLKDVLLPLAGPGTSGLEARLNAGLLGVLDAYGEVFFSEAEIPRLGLRRRQPFLEVNITQTTVRAGIRRVDGGIRLALARHADEWYYGWGERFEAFQRNTGTIKARTMDAIAPLQGRGESYSAIPFFLSSRGYGFFLLNSHAARWKLDEARLVVEADGPGADYILIRGAEFKHLLEIYTALTGRPPLVPKWAFGLWVTSYPQDHQRTVLEHARRHRQDNIPLDAVILDYHWEQAFHNFQWRKSLFPDPDGLIAGLKQLGIRLGLITTPFINNRNRWVQQKLLRLATHSPLAAAAGDDERALPEYRHGLERGFFAHPAAKWWFGSGGMLDFTHPQAAAWWNALSAPLYAQGVSFFKNDDGEYLPETARAANGMDGSEYHNLYGFYYGRALHNGMTAEGDRRGLVYARSVWAGSQRHPAVFLGDQKPTFAHMRASLRAGLNIGLAGFAYWTADVFGLDGKTTPETHMRYAQWALLNPLARYFWRPAEIDDTRFPWSHGAEAEANFRKYTELRYRLLPYYYALACEARQTGMPFVRPLLLEYPDDPRFADCADQYLLGSDLLVAPVLEAGSRSRRILLPAGTWHDFWSDAKWQGPGGIEYAAPPDCLPVLARGGSILPLGPVLQSIPDGHRFEQLELHAYGPLPAEGSLYDDDGTSREYERGAFCWLGLRIAGSREKPSLEIQKLAGDWDWKPDARIVVHE